MIPVRRLNHAVLFVRDARASAAFYEEAFGFEAVTGDDRAVFLRAAGSDNHHDLGLFTVGSEAPPPPPRAIGLYHLAWEVDHIDDLVAARDVLEGLGALVGASDHGATKSLYGRDPDGHEFEIMWMLPRERWGDFERSAVVEPLDLAAEVERHGRATPTDVAPSN